MSDVQHQTKVSLYAYSRWLLAIEVASLNLLNALTSLEPVYTAPSSTISHHPNFNQQSHKTSFANSPILGELLHPRLQLGLMQRIIIHRPNPHDFVSWKSRSHTVHQRSADGAEEICHFAAGFDRVALGVAGEFVFTAKMFDASVGNDEVGCEHRGGDFATIGAVAWRW